MSDILPSNLELLLGKDPSKTGGGTAQPQTPTWGAEGEKKIKEVEAEERRENEVEEEEEEEEEMVSSANLEPTTLQWPGDGAKAREKGSVTEQEREGAGGRGRKGDDLEGERRSMRSECLSLRGESRTESERELGSEKRKTGEGWMEAERETEDTGLRKRGKKGQIEIDVEEEEEEGMNSLPEKAARVFNPSVTILHSSSVPTSSRDNDVFWDAETEKSPFLGPHGTPPDGYYHDWPMEGESSKCEEPPHQHDIFLFF